MADLGQRRTDHESAERMGCGQARCAAGGGAMLDPRLPRGTERPICPVPSVFLERLEFLQEQRIRKELAVASVATGCSREACRSEQRLRPAGVREADDPEDV